MWQLPPPFFWKYFWWYSSARQNVVAGTISVTIGLFSLPDFPSRSMEAVAAVCCAGE